MNKLYAPIGHLGAALPAMLKYKAHLRLLSLYCDARYEQRALHVHNFLYRTRYISTMNFVTGWKNILNKTL